MLKKRSFIRKERLEELRRRERSYFDLEFLKAFEPEDQCRFFQLLDKSTSQLRQDLFVLSQSGFKKGGYFVEFGATDGRSHNNTFLLEREFDWTGILAEPAQGWHSDLRRNRSCIIEERCVWKASGDTLAFTETPRGENSSISEFTKTRRKIKGKNYSVLTISLNDLLSEHRAPKVIDYISVDTEGSEFEILKSFDFNRWDVRTFTIEHNFAAQRGDIHSLMTKNGYRRVMEAQSRFDDWYIKAT
jgi:FkbM family methyltransferase